jgi:molybdopterin/thiamine biosynthesis adenylyltransferase
MGTDEEDQEEATEIDTEAKTPGTYLGSGKVLDIDDEAVKDRWSRYIGAMGIEAVAKQAASSIFLSGAGALGIEIAKNLVLAGCKTFTLHDNKPVTYRDLSGQFFLNLEEDLLNEKRKKRSRGEACLPRLKQLNYYVKCTLAPVEPLPLDVLTMEQWGLGAYEVIILTEATDAEIIAFDEYCRQTSKKLIVADAYGVFTRVFNDFGPAFEVLDKNGEELQDVMIKSIETGAEEALVELLPHTKHRFEDGDEVLITGVEGMLT